MNGCNGNSHRSKLNNKKPTSLRLGLSKKFDLGHRIFMLDFKTLKLLINVHECMQHDIQSLLWIYTNCHTIPEYHVFLNFEKKKNADLNFVHFNQNITIIIHQQIHFVFLILPLKWICLVLSLLLIGQHPGLVNT